MLSCIYIRKNIFGETKQNHIAKQFSLIYQLLWIVIKQPILSTEDKLVIMKYRFKFYLRVEILPSPTAMTLG